MVMTERLLLLRDLVEMEEGSLELPDFGEFDVCRFGVSGGGSMPLSPLPDLTRYSYGSGVLVLSMKALLLAKILLLEDVRMVAAVAGELAPEYCVVEDEEGLLPFPTLLFVE